MQTIRRAARPTSLPLALGFALALGLSAWPGPAGAAPPEGGLVGPHSSHSRHSRPASQSARSRPPAAWSSVIVQWRGARTPDRLRRLAGLGARADRPLPLIGADTLRLPTPNLGRLAALPFVRHVSPDLACRKSDGYTVGATGADVAFAQGGLTGAGVAVAVLDSGIQSERADIAGRTVAAADFTGDAVPDDAVPDGEVAGDAGDACGHGTHVAGIIAGDGTGSTGPAFFRTFYGVARGASLVDVRVLDGNGRGTVSGVIRGIGWAVAHKSDYGIGVLNLSLGHPVGESYATDPLCLAVEAAWKSGIVVVCAAGNEGRLRLRPGRGGGLAGQAGANGGWGTNYGSIQSPANDPYVITVGAMKSVDGARADDQIATYSGRGPSRLDFVLKPDLVAPGNRIVSVNANGSYLGTAFGPVDAVGLSEYSTLTAAPADTYLRLSGTSMAAPVVAGAAALLLESDPTLTPDTVKARLMASADKAGYGESGAGDDDPCTYGAGYLDIPAALQSTLVATQPALSPTLACDSSGLVSVDAMPLTAAEAGFWGTGLPDPSGVWGAAMPLYGVSVGNRSIIWGESNRSIIWGESIGAQSVWNDSIIWGEGLSGADLSSTVLLGDPDVLAYGPLSFLRP